VGSSRYIDILTHKQLYKVTNNQRTAKRLSVTWISVSYLDITDNGITGWELKI